MTIYGDKAVSGARRYYENIANNAPVFRESANTAAARSAADGAQTAYRDTVNRGYQSAYGTTIANMTRQYAGNRFNYSAENDSNYQALADNYRNAAELNNENAQGSYAANTGGYGNSYAQAAGQRAYNQTMDELHGKATQLRETARQEYNQNQDNLMDQISMLRGFDDTQYQRYRDSVQNKFDFMSYYASKYATAQGVDMSNFQNELTRWSANLNAAQGEYANIRQLAEQQRQHNTLSADTKAQLGAQKTQNGRELRYKYDALNSEDRRNAAYYSYLGSKLK